jgi:hypothetical protein
MSEHSPPSNDAMDVSNPCEGDVLMFEHSPPPNGATDISRPGEDGVLMSEHSPPPHDAMDVSAITEQPSLPSSDAVNISAARSDIPAQFPQSGNVSDANMSDPTRSHAISRKASIPSVWLTKRRITRSPSIRRDSSPQRLINMPTHNNITTNTAPSNGVDTSDTRGRQITRKASIPVVMLPKRRTTQSSSIRRDSSHQRLLDEPANTGQEGSNISADKTLSDGRVSFS